MKLRLFLGILIVITGMGPCIEAGEIYQWIDKDGVQHFTDGPPPPGAQIVEGLSETPSFEPPANTGATAPKDTGTVPDRDSNLTDGEETGAVESGENSPPDREAYWRRLGWKNSPTDGEETGAAEGGENSPPDREETGAVKDGEDGPIPERKID